MLDYVGLGADLTEEEKLLRDNAREFVRERVEPDIADHYQAGTFPTELIPEMGELGFYAPNLEGYGSPNVSERAYGVLMQELEACDSGLRSMASVQGALVMYRSKRWVTNGPIADVVVVWARLSSAEGSPVRGFLVETDRDGVEIDRIEDKLSMRASISGEMELDGVRIPEANVLPDVEGMKGPLSCLTQARYGIAWGAVGAARDCFETAREYATDREQFGGPIARFQLQQDKLAEMATQITLGQLLVHRLADLKERGELRPQQVSMAKRHNVRMAREQSKVAREMLGGNGITADYSPMRHMANMETVYTYEGTHDIHSLILGEDLTGIAAFE